MLFCHYNSHDDSEVTVRAMAIVSQLHRNVTHQHQQKSFNIQHALPITSMSRQYNTDQVDTQDIQSVMDGLGLTKI